MAQLEAVLFDGAVSPDLISAAILCKKLCVSRSAVFYWRKAGMPYYSLGVKTYRYVLSEVLDWLDARDWDTARYLDAVKKKKG